MAKHIADGVTGQEFTVDLSWANNVGVTSKTAGGTSKDVISLDSTDVIQVSPTDDSVDVKIGSKFTFDVSLGDIAATTFTGSGASITGVDAATLDTLDSLQFLRSDANDSITTGVTLNIDSGATISIDGAWDIAGTAVTSTAAELNILDGVTSTTAELNILDGVTASATEINKLTSSASSAGSILFSDGAKFTEDNSNLFWDDTNNRLGIGTITPSQSIETTGNLAAAVLFLTGGTTDVVWQGVGTDVMRTPDSLSVYFPSGAAVAFDIGHDNPSTYSRRTWTRKTSTNGASTKSAYDFFQHIGTGTTTDIGVYQAQYDQSQASTTTNVKVIEALGTSSAGTTTNIYGVYSDLSGFTATNSYDFYGVDGLSKFGNTAIGGTTFDEVLTVEGVTSLAETTAPTSTSGYGKLYVKSSNSKLYFMDDSGTETNLSSAGTSEFTDGGDTAGATRVLGNNDAFDLGLEANGTTVLTIKSAGGVELSTSAPATPVANNLYKDTIVKAWCKFNGSGTVSLDADANVSSITDNGTGDYTVNWATAFSSTNYSVVGSSLDASAGNHAVVTLGTLLVGSADVRARQGDGTLTDPTILTVLAIGAQ